MPLPHAAQKDRGLIPGPGVSAHPGLAPGLNATRLWAGGGLRGRTAACPIPTHTTTIQEEACHD